MAVASSAAVDHALARLAVATEDHLVSFLRSKLPQLSASNQNSLSLGDPVVIILPVFLKAVHNFANVRESVFILGSNQRSVIFNSNPGHPQLYSLPWSESLDELIAHPPRTSDLAAELLCREIFSGGGTTSKLKTLLLKMTTEKENETTKPTRRDVAKSGEKEEDTYQKESHNFFPQGRIFRALKTEAKGSDETWLVYKNRWPEGQCVKIQHLTQIQDHKSSTFAERYAPLISDESQPNTHSVNSNMPPLKMKLRQYEVLLSDVYVDVQSSENIDISLPVANCGYLDTNSTQHFVEYHEDAYRRG